MELRRRVSMCLRLRFRSVGGGLDGAGWLRQVESALRTIFTEPFRQTPQAASAGSVGAQRFLARAERLPGRVRRGRARASHVACAHRTHMMPWAEFGPRDPTRAPPLVPASRRGIGSHLHAHPVAPARLDRASFRSALSPLLRSVRWGPGGVTAGRAPGAYPSTSGHAQRETASETALLPGVRR